MEGMEGSWRGEEGERVDDDDYCNMFCNKQTTAPSTTTTTMCG